jgi:hypothetical protein
MTVTIRRPPCIHVGEPNVAITGIWTPVPAVVQVFVSDDIMRDISRRPRIFIAVVAAIAPVVEIVGITEIFHLRVQPIRSFEGGALARANGISLSAAG